MISEQERFTHVMDLLELEVAGLEQHEDLAMVDRIAKLVGDISTKITDAENQGGQLQHSMQISLSIINNTLSSRFRLACVLSVTGVTQRQCSVSGNTIPVGKEAQRLRANSIYDLERQTQVVLSW